ncbi:hypothetical protein J2T12_005119 [Paenibacillus anaericanus]|uniref:glycosyl hydrolase family 28-related protein n=1 Tax=Paenibacillus anaericanus TaxID=170367 RepID=UPI00277F648C|nr:glycosyl hydrolase family 28-related protein [Paenibacillus anaericanus]MDQ0091679.1 hypothetical protein [Paenibacillus anaericanus]
MTISRLGGITGTVDISEDFENINKAFNNTVTELDTNKTAAEATKTALDNHKASTTAHSADHITNSGNTPGANVEQALDGLTQRIGEIIQGGGPDKDIELVDIRTPDPTYTPARTITVAGDMTRDMQAQFTAQLADTVKKDDLVYNVKDYGAIGNGIADDTVAFKNTISAAKSGSILFIPDGEYKITDELVINKVIRFEGTLANDAGYCALLFNLDGLTASKVAIRVNNQMHGTVIRNLYVINKGAEHTRDGILFDGIAGDYPDYIWYSRLEGVWVSKFNNNFLFNNCLVMDVVKCRSIEAYANGFYSESVVCSTGLSFRECYAQDGVNGAGFKLSKAYYASVDSCFSDGNKWGFHALNCNGVSMRSLGSESCIRYAIFIQNSSVIIDGITTIDSGTDNTNIFYPTVIEVESGYASIRNVQEQDPHAGSTRLYSVLFENGARGDIVNCNELLDTRINMDGLVSLNHQFLISAMPTTMTGFKIKDVGRVYPMGVTSEVGAAGSKYVVTGYQRLSTGNNNVLNVDWRELRAFTGN